MRYDMTNRTNDSRQTNIPALGETDLDDVNSIGNAASAAEKQNDDSTKVYQDDLNYKDSDIDPIINEDTESPADELQIPEDEYKDELNKFIDTDTGTGDDDMRETIEDRDEDDDNSASSTQ